MIDQKTVQRELRRSGNVRFEREYMNKYIDEMEKIVTQAERLSKQMVDVASKNANAKGQRMYGDVQNAVKALRKVWDKILWF